jgi:hypothetical protein
MAADDPSNEGVDPSNAGPAMEVLSRITLEQARAVFPSLADPASMQAMSGRDLAYLNRLVQVHADLTTLDRGLRDRFEAAFARDDRIVATWRRLVDHRNVDHFDVAGEIERFVLGSELADAFRG